MTPGSPEAIKKGCLCNSRDNHKGKGIVIGDKAPLFWKHPLCPLHGAEAEALKELKKENAK